MKTLYLIALVSICRLSFAQDNQVKVNTRQGLIFGTAIGASYINLTKEGTPKQEETSFSLPNFKIGYMLNNNFALVVNLPGTVYKFKDSGRKRDRGFEGIIPSIQYWPKNNWWISAGAGLCMDAPAFYDIKDSTERKFYFGPGLICGTGCELWKKNNFALDIQSRLHYGYTNMPGGNKKGLAFTIALGFNWH